MKHDCYMKSVARKSEQPLPLHIGIIWPTAALRYDPGDILTGVLDVTGFAVYAVLRIDLEPWHVRLAPRRSHIHPPGNNAALVLPILASWTDSGTPASANCRCTGWLSSWLVLERNTDDDLSKLNTPSGFGVVYLAANCCGFK